MKKVEINIKLEVSFSEEEWKEMQKMYIVTTGPNSVKGAIERATRQIIEKEIVPDHISSIEVVEKE